MFFCRSSASAFILALRGDDEATKNNARWAALATTLITFVLSLVAYAKLDLSSSAFQLVEEKHWFGGGLVYKLGLDGLSAPFVVLTTFLMPFCIAASWQAIQNRVKEYMIAFLVLETLMIGVFCALDLVLFYLFFEGVLIPMFLIIGIWGGISGASMRRSNSSSTRCLALCSCSSPSWRCIPMPARPTSRFF